MLENLTKDDWTPCLDDDFQIQIDPSSSLAVKLTQVSGYGKRIGAHREAYSLTFCGPQQPILPQRIYRISHSELGDLDLFLVPVGPQKDGMGYEAVFT